MTSLIFIKLISLNIIHFFERTTLFNFHPVHFRAYIFQKASSQHHPKQKIARSSEGTRAWLLYYYIAHHADYKKQSYYQYTHFTYISNNIYFSKN